MAERIHFIGIGGAGMSSIARVMHSRGIVVTGSDQKGSLSTEKLAAEGIQIHIGHEASNVGDVDLVVYSAAVPKDNPELIIAREKGIETINRAQMLGRLMQPYPNRVAITGTHGKTTTTSMAGLVLTEAGLDPTVLIGGDLIAFGGNTRIGGDSLFVTEACEAFDSFLNLYPSVAVITNVDADHLDFHGTLEKIIESFKDFVSHVDEDGCIIACLDDPNVKKVLEGYNGRVVGYSLKDEGEYQAADISIDSPHASYELVKNRERLGRITLGVPGLQNIANSLAAVAVGFEYGASFDAIKAALAQFNGTGRRFEVLGTVNDIMVVDDYAHHPCEVKVTLESVRAGWDRRIIAVFQPHLYSRTKFFAGDFAKSLSLADVVVVTDIYAAREKPMEGVTSRLISDNIKGTEVHHIADKSEIPAFLASMVKPGDMVITLGAGDIRAVGEELLKSLKPSGCSCSCGCKGKTC